MIKEVLMQECVGRAREKRIFEAALTSNEPEMVAITGRRRVGKTFLIRSVLKDKIDFEITGMHNGSLKEQLQNFSEQLTQFSASRVPLAVPTNWLAAFHQLSIFLEEKKTKRKKVVFIDELPWIATHKSGFMGALEYFWNSWASKKEIVVILCGSAASWMLRRLVHNKGGLHNRITRQIRLEPFDLHETQLFFASRNVAVDPYQLIQIYMVTGGIPHYLKEVRSGQSAAQNIDRICFEPQGFLKDEFSKLYSSLFEHPENHIKIIRALAQHRKGLTRKEVLDEAKMEVAFPEFWKNWKAPALSAPIHRLESSRRKRCIGSPMNTPCFT
jgi:AAA+ ATPase superfamily predicted ATPase